MSVQIDPSILVNLVVGLGLVELLKEMLKKSTNFFVDEKLVKLKESVSKKQEIKDKITYLLAFGSSHQFQDLPKDEILIEATSKLFELRSINKKLSSRIDNFLFQWRLYCYLLESKDLYQDLLESIHEYLEDEVEDLIDDLAKLI